MSTRTRGHVEVAGGQRQDVHAPRPRPVDERGELGAALVVGVAAPGEDHALGVVVGQEPHLLLLELGAAVGVADDRQVAGLGAHVLDPARDLGEVGVDDVADDHADDPAALRDEGPGQGARRVAELLRGRQHSLAGRVGDRMVERFRTREAVAIETPARRDTSASDPFGGLLFSVIAVGAAARRSARGARVLRLEARESFSTARSGARLTRFSNASIV